MCILPISLNMDNGNISDNNIQPQLQPKPLQLVTVNTQNHTQPIVTVNTQNHTPTHITHHTQQNSAKRNYRLQSWQFVDQKNDSPMFQFISTPKSDPPTHPNHQSAPRMCLIYL